MLKMHDSTTCIEEIDIKIVMLLLLKYHRAFSVQRYTWNNGQTKKGKCVFGFVDCATFS
jgi:hypothetical protein